MRLHNRRIISLSAFDATIRQRESILPQLQMVTALLLVSAELHSETVWIEDVRCASELQAAALDLG
jgi:hypothetical protein